MRGEAPSWTLRLSAVLQHLDGGGAAESSKNQHSANRTYCRQPFSTNIESYSYTYNYNGQKCNPQ